MENRFTTICGGVALQAGFLVAFKQLVPEHTVTLFKGVIKVRVKHFPALFLLVNTLSGPIFGTDVAAVLAWLGFLSSWTYLRFYKRSFPDLGSNQAPSLQGDASEIFGMCAFPLLDIPGWLVADACVRWIVPTSSQTRSIGQWRWSPTWFTTCSSLSASAPHSRRQTFPPRRRRPKLVATWVLVHCLAAVGLVARGEEEEEEEEGEWEE